MRFLRSATLISLPLALAASSLGAQRADTAAYTATECPSCAGWNAANVPFRIHGSTWYVGTRGLSAILITSDQGHVLIDAGLPESAPLIAANIRALGFRAEDIRLILNSHAHYDHAGGIAAIQRMSNARVAVSAASAAAVRTGKGGRDDPQFEILLAHPPAARVETFAYGDTLRIGAIEVVPHRTAGHTAGGTTWAWRSCTPDGCADVVYADSQTPVSAPSFLFTRNDTYPSAIADFEQGARVLESLSCDILLTPHPSASGMFDRVSTIDREGCRRLAATARRNLANRIAQEKK